MKIFLALFLLGSVVIISSCKKLGWKKDKDPSACYCIYYSAPGIEKREVFHYRSSNNITYFNNLCAKKEKELAQAHGLTSYPRCRIDE